MESIHEILARLSHGANIQGPKNTTEAVEQQTQAQLLEQLRRSLKVSSLNHTFANWEHVLGGDACYRAFLALATREDAKPFLLCYGGVGNGKTYLCEALVIEWYKWGSFCRVSTMAEIMHLFKMAMKPDSGLLPYEVLVDNFCQAQRLVLDDVGMGGSGSAWEFGQLEEIVVARYHERLITVMTTNRDLKELPERIVSRFADRAVGLLVLNEAVDYRTRYSVEGVKSVRQSWNNTG